MTLVNGFFLQRKVEGKTWLAHLVSRFACNTRVIVDASSSPTVSRIMIAVTKTYYQIIK